MESKELEVLKKDFDYDINRLRYEHQRFKRRVCIVTNIYIPGIGYFLYGKSYIKGLISFIFFFSYTFWFFNRLIYDTSGRLEIAHIVPSILFYAPALIVSAISTLDVAFLKE